jgi:glycosyltransferase 2 family protein
VNHGKRWLSLGIRVAGTVLAVSWIAHRLEIGPVLERLGAVPLWAFVVAPLGAVLNTWIHALRLASVLRVLGADLGIAGILSALFRGAFVGLVLPPGGNALSQLALLGHAGPGLRRATSAMVVVRILQLPVWIALLLWGLFSGHLVPPLAVAAICFALPATCVLLWVAPSQPWIPQWFRRFEWVDRARAGFQLIKKERHLVAGNMALGAVSAMINCGVVWILLWAAGHPLSLSTVLSVVPAADVLIWLPVSISGIGIRESVFALALAPWGIGLVAAVSIALTRWVGELARGAIGCMLWLLSTAGRSSRSSGDMDGGIENE